MTAITIPNTFLPSTTISSTAMNANFNEVADKIELSLALDGTDSMTGALRHSNGSALLPSMTFASDLNVGVFRKTTDELGFATNGTLAAYLDAAQKAWFLGAADIAGALHVATTMVVDGAATLTGAITTAGVLTALSTIELGNAADTTLSRLSAGNVGVEGNLLYRAGGTDVAVVDGGTGAGTPAGARTGLGAILTDAVFPGALLAIIEDRQSAGTDDGTFTSGADRTRTLNTLAYNRNTVAALAANQFTLPAGSYEIKWSAPGFQCGNNQTVLRDVTAGADVARGSSEKSNNAGNTTTRSIGSARVAPAGTNVYELRHRCTDTQATNGFGVAANVGGTEVYSRVEIYAS